MGSQAEVKMAQASTPAWSRMASTSPFHDRFPTAAYTSTERDRWMAMATTRSKPLHRYIPAGAVTRGTRVAI